MKLEMIMGKTYRIKKWDREHFAMVPESNEDLFGDLYAGRESGRTNVLIYTTDERIDASKDFSVALAYALSSVRDFDVYISTERNAELSDYVDVVISGFGLEGIEDKLEGYDNGSKVFVGPSELSGIRSERDFKGFVRSLRNALDSKVEKREVVIG